MPPAFRESVEAIATALPAHLRHAVLAGVRWALDHDGEEPPSIPEACRIAGNRDNAVVFLKAVEITRRSMWKRR